MRMILFLVAEDTEADECGAEISGILIGLISRTWQEAASYGKDDIDPSKCWHCFILLLRLLCIIVVFGPLEGSVPSWLSSLTFDSLIQ
jgi:hypothetical protein